jgi:hypothetical protein
MDIELLSRLITYLVFGWVGYVWAKKLSLPARLVDWLLWLIALLIAGTIQFKIVDIFGFVILSQDLLRALVLGVLVNFILRLTRPELSPAKTKS